MKIATPKAKSEYELATDPAAWEVLEIHGQRIPGDIEPTDAARQHWQEKHADEVFGYVPFAAEFQEDDILSILSAAKAGKARLSKNRFGAVASYKLLAA